MISILVMDDDPNLRRLFSKTLSKMYRVYTSATCAEASVLLSQHHFDIFVCDMLMGEELGIDLLRESLTSLRSQGTRVVVLSADNRYFEQCRQMGIECIISKPVMPHSLIHIVEDLLEKAPQIL